MSEYRFLKNLKKIKRKKDLEPQEVFLDKLAAKKEEDIGISERKFEVPLSNKIIAGLFLFFFLLALVIFGKTFQLQVLGKDKFLALSEENKFLISSIKSERGVIYDVSGKQLVFNQASFDVFLDKSLLPQGREKEVIQQAAGIIGISLKEIEKRAEAGQGRVLIKKNIDHQALILLETKILELPGFEIVKNSSRHYEKGFLFSHLIGHVGRISSKELKAEPDIYSAADYVGKEGIEASFEEQLRTNPGKIQTERDVFGNPISREIRSFPESGNSLVLWLDSGLQEKIEQELKNTLERIGSEKAVGIALNPKNGAVMSLVSIPSYDNNIFSGDVEEDALKEILEDERNPLFNRAISGLYPTGSTIKPLVAMAALQEQLISPDKKVYCKGEIAIPHRYDPEITYFHKDWTVHGPTDMRKAIAESCNVYFYTIGGGYEDQPGLGPTKIKSYLELFGWAKKTGIDLPGESEGLIPWPAWKQEKKGEGWWDGDTYNLSIGQGDILITPLQVAVSFATVANKGTLFKPLVAKEIINSSKEIVEEISPEAVRQDFVSEENIEIVRQGMRAAVTGQGAPQASAVALNSLPVPVAAKTGTAQTPYEDHYHNWITVFGPYDDPEIVLLIMFENVKGLQVTAIPTAKNILEWYFAGQEQ